MGDLDAVRRALDGAGLVLVDNTSATPILCRPLELGADLVMHSATKYIGGHSDLLAGVVVGDTDLITAARARSVRTGATLGPFDAWLALRGLRTLDVRMRRHSDNSFALARALSTMPGVTRVHHPLLEVSSSFAVSR